MSRICTFTLAGTSGVRAVDTVRPLIALGVIIRTSGGLSHGPNDPYELRRTEFYGRADEHFVWGQIIQFKTELFKAKNYTSKSWRGPGKGRVWGFSKQNPCCLIVLRDGVKYPERYNHTFWEPT